MNICYSTADCDFYHANGLHVKMKLKCDLNVCAMSPKKRKILKTNLDTHSTVTSKPVFIHMGLENLYNVLETNLMHDKTQS